MTAHTRLPFVATVFVGMAWGSWICAADDVTSPVAAAASPAQKALAPDGTPVVHKSLHKKKHAATTTASSAAASPTSPAPTAESKPVQKSVTITVVSTVVSPAEPAPVHPSAVPQAGAPSPVWGPTVETGLPVARYPGMGTPIKGVSTYIPMPATVSPAKSVATTHPASYAGVFPSAMVPMTSSAAGSYSSPGRSMMPSSGVVFTRYSKKAGNTYPWRSGIVTTMFWIGEPGSSISPTDNVKSSWDEDWLPRNHGSDSPNNRNGYASGSHASTVNPFYVALPFNDLAFPEQAREWLPRNWHRPPKDGKQVSACKDRWVEIKNAQGRICFAQWEDVGPLRYDNAEYVFGGERPTGLGGDRAGLDVSPAVAQYLGIDGTNRITSWRFVDDEDVLPGHWLILDEQAVLFTAFQQLKNHSRSSELPIQRATEPADDPENIDSNKKKVAQSKG